MKRRRWQLWFGVSVGLLLFVACGQSEDKQWQTFMDRGAEAFAAKKYDLADSLYSAAWLIAQDWPREDRRWAVTAERAAHAKSFRGQYDIVIDIYKKLLDYRIQTLGEDDLEVARLKYKLAYHCDWRSRYDEAKDYYADILKVYEEKLGPEHDDTYHCLKRYAWAYRQTGFFDEAESLFTRAIAIRERKDIKGDEELVTDLERLAEIYELQMEYDLAEEAYRRGLRIREEAHGPDHHLVANSLEKLILLLREMDRTEEANKLAERVDRIRTTLK